ncbi:ATP-dependent helicase [Candidatus Phytoplasma tritici]|uniref:ATP-dependent helicase n=1 Tax=Candidatus Phytoplasma tritici TaxID=321961 RepID=UPI00042A8713|nr:UvrD-helicase domain-containing protein [Candidatus Phytoplasma tritici]
MFSNKTNFLEKLNKPLNQAQLAAVTSNAKSFYLVAGAGTGKTTTLTAKIAYLIEQKNLPSNQILALTFTNKAAKQMQEKLVQMIGKEKTKGITICTFHSLGNQILRKFIPFLPFAYRNNFKILDDNDCKKIIKDILKKMNIDPKRVKISELKKSISAIKRKHEPQNEDTLQHGTQKEHNFQRENRYEFEMPIKVKYQIFLQNNNLVDFDDLILYTHQLLQENADVRVFYQQKFQYLLVDEFQDTDFFQYQILTLLAQKHQNIFVVGDPDQNIYSFRGARFENSQLFLNKFKPQIAFLEQNYRSSKNILDKANLLIKYNESNIFKKNLKSTKSEGEAVIYKFFEDYKTETNYITKTIQNLVLKGIYRYQDFTILYRTNILGRPLEEKFLSNNIPYQVFGGTSFYQSKVVKDFLAYLNVIANPSQDFDFKRIINTPKRGIGTTSLLHLEKLAQEKNLALFDAINYLEQTPIKQNNKTKLNEFQKLITTLRQELINDSFDCLSDIITYIDEKIGYCRKNDKTCKMKSIKDFEPALHYIEELKSVFMQAEKNLEGSGVFEKLTQLLDQISLYSETNEQTEQDPKNPSKNDRVKLSTIHKVKGLEFRVVFIAAFEDIFFDCNQKEKSDLEESRRLAYVAVTRAEEKLFLTGACQRISYGKQIDSKPSRFLQEMGVFQKENPRTNYFSPHLFQPKQSNQISSTNGNGFFQKGDKVKHKTLGLGVVETIMQDLIQVRFINSQNIKIFENTTAFLAKIEE